MPPHPSLEGALLGAAIGDALGLASEGMSAEAAARRPPGYGLIPGVGLVSDDTEQSALVASCLARHPRDVDAFTRAFRRALLGWFLRLPWGLGWATLRACLRILFGLSRSGVRSAGNGAAMRAPILGAFFCDNPDLRRRFGLALATVTHTDQRGVQGALYAAELCALCCTRPASPRADLAREALSVVDEPELSRALLRALELSDRPTPGAALELGNTGFILHTLPLCVHAFVAHGDRYEEAIAKIIAAGGDTDSTAAILGAWLGALHGPGALPERLVSTLQRGPFGLAHLRALALDLSGARSGTPPPRPARFSWPLAALRNLALFPVVLLHAFRVMASRLTSPSAPR